MSKAVKTVVKIALPIAAGFVLGPAGFGLTSAAVGGAIGGAAAGAIGGGGVKGALIGAAGGYLAGGAVGSPAGSTLATTTGNAAMQGPTYGTGIAGALSGGGTKALLASTATGAAQSGVMDYAKLVGNQLVAQGNADTAKESAQTMSNSIDKAIAAQSPYTQLGQSAVTQINQIQADPAGYIQGNPLYTSLAADAERRLTAIQAAKGKLGSGGTASALQEQLLGLGTGLVNNQITNLQNQANTGANAASNVSASLTNQGQVQAAGQVGANNAQVAGYQNQLDTLLALQSANKAQVPNQTNTIYR